MTASDIINALGELLTLFLSVFGDCTTTIMDNPLLFVPIGFSIAGMLILLGVGLFRKFGVRGISSSGGRRRR